MLFRSRYHRSVCPHRATHTRFFCQYTLVFSLHVHVYIRLLESTLRQIHYFFQFVPLHNTAPSFVTSFHLLVRPKKTPKVVLAPCDRNTVAYAARNAIGNINIVLTHWKKWVNWCSCCCIIFIPLTIHNRVFRHICLQLRYTAAHTVAARTRTVVRECGKGDDESLWERGKFDSRGSRPYFTKSSPLPGGGDYTYATACRRVGCQRVAFSASLVVIIRIDNVIILKLLS